MDRLVLTIVFVVATALLQLAALFLVCSALARVQNQIHRAWYMLNAILGTTVHEMSHAAACLVTGTRITQFRPFSPQPDGTLGSVTHEGVGFLRRGFIALAPLAGNTIALYFVVRCLFPGYGAHTAPILSIWTGTDILDMLYAYGQAYWGYMREILVVADVRDWHFWAFAFLAMSLGAHAAPSRADLRAFFPALLVMACAVGALLVASTASWWPRSAGIVPEWLATGIRIVNTVLAQGTAFGSAALAMNIVIWLPLRAIGVAQGAATGRAPKSSPRPANQPPR